MERTRKMKTHSITAVLAVAFALAASSQAHAASDNAGAFATVVAPIAIDKTADLNFGEVAANGVAGTVVMSPTGSRSSTDGATLGSAVGASAASFTVSGNPSAAYTIMLPGTITLNLVVKNAGGPTSMDVDNFTSTPTVADGGTIGGGGTQTLNVGATLNVQAFQTQGDYSGSFEVTVAYD